MTGSFHNLPREHDAPLADYEELLGHMSGIAASESSVRVHVGRPPAQWPYFQALGRLKPFASPSGRRGLFAINTHESRDEGGLVALYEDHFRSGHLHTFDGNDYFTLTVEMEEP